jgi:hypothetical protein
MKKKAPAAKRATKGKKSGKKTVRDLEVKGVRGGSIKGGGVYRKVALEWK